MESYLIRIYRRGEKNNKDLAGIIEQIGIAGQMVFQTTEDLIKILSSNNESEKTKS